MLLATKTSFLHIHLLLLPSCMPGISFFGVVAAPRKHKKNEREKMKCWVHALSCWPRWDPPFIKSSSFLWFMTTLKQSSTFSLAAKCTHVWSVSVYGLVGRVEGLLAKEMMQANEETVRWICIYNFTIKRDNCHFFCKGSVKIPQCGL